MRVNIYKERGNRRIRSDTNEVINLKILCVRGDVRFQMKVDNVSEGKFWI